MQNLPSCLLLYPDGEAEGMQQQAISNVIYSTQHS